MRWLDMECYPIRCDCTSTLTAKWCEPTSNAMPHAWFSLDILTTLVHIFSHLHDRNFFWGMLSTRCLGKTLDLVLTPLYSTHQVQNQKELAVISHLDSDQIRCHLPPRFYLASRNLTNCVLDHSVYTYRQGRIWQVLPHGLMDLFSEYSTHRWYSPYVLQHNFLYLIYFSLTYALNNVPMLSSANFFDSSALTAISPEFMGQPLCASSYLYSTHFCLICTLCAVFMLRASLIVV